MLSNALYFDDLLCYYKLHGGDFMEIKEILKTERIKHNLSQQEIADYLKVKRETYTMYEIGKNIPPTYNIIKLADLYKCSTDYLLGRYS
jgi:transcriptional regulator with XRE-family HTH domain